MAEGDNIPPVNCGFPEGKHKLDFRIPIEHVDAELTYRTEACAEEGRRIGVFEIRSNGVVVNRNRSTPFPAGSFEKVSAELKKKNNVHIYQVKVSNPKKLSLRQYFDD